MTRLFAYRALLLAVGIPVLFPSFGAQLTAQQLIATVTTGVQGSYLATNSVTNKVYISSQYGNSVAAIDGGDFSVVSIPVASPGFVAVNEVTNKVYVAGGTGGLVVIDGATNTTTSVTLPYFGGLMVVNPATNKIYVLNTFEVEVVDGTTLAVTTVPVGSYPTAIALNRTTNKIFVTNAYDSDVTVIDGATNSSTTVQTYRYPWYLAIDEYQNKIYVGCSGSGEVTVIDGQTLSTTSLNLSTGNNLVAMDVDSHTHKVYFAIDYDQYTNYVVVLDGQTLQTTQIPIGARSPQYLKVEPSSNRIYVNFADYQIGPGELVINGSTNTFTDLFLASGNPTQIATDSLRDRVYSIVGQQVYVVAGPSAMRFVPTTPCRVVDTRQPNGPFGGPPIPGGTSRSFALPQGNCNIPPDAAAYALNVTVVPQGHLAYLTVWPTGLSQPYVSTMNSFDGRTKANAAIVGAGGSTAISVYASDTTNVVIDVDGYFERSNVTALSFFPLPSCRVVDTRNPNGPLGGPYLAANQERDFPLQSSSCSIPSSATAYSLNVTALPHGHLGYLTVWPEGQQQPQVSTLNAPTGTATANAALVRAGTSGGISAYPSNDTDLLVDVNGYFAPAAPGGLSLYTIPPCRVLDTRSGGGQFRGTILVDVIDSGCGLQDALAYVINATVLPRGYEGYLTIWPTTQFEPATSTLNAWDGATTSNMSIVPSVDGWLNAFSSNTTNLLIDGMAFFAP